MHGRCNNWSKRITGSENSFKNLVLNISNTTMGNIIVLTPLTSLPSPPPSITSANSTTATSTNNNNAHLPPSLSSPSDYGKTSTMDSRNHGHLVTPHSSLSQWDHVQCGTLSSFFYPFSQYALFSFSIIALVFASIIMATHYSTGLYWPICCSSLLYNLFCSITYTFLFFFLQSYCLSPFVSSTTSWPTM